MKRPATPAKKYRVTQMSLQADLSASSILRRLVREVARGTDMTSEEVVALQLSVTKAFMSAIGQEVNGTDGHVLVTVHAADDEVQVELAYRERQPSTEAFLTNS